MTLTQQVGRSPFPPIPNFLEYAIERGMKMIDKDYAEEIREALSADAFRDEAQFRIETLPDVRASYLAEVEHVGKSIFGASFNLKQSAKQAIGERK